MLFTDKGVEAVACEIDAFHDEPGIAVEVEAGRGAQNNGDYRDIIRASLILDARYLVLLMPQVYRFNSGGREQGASVRKLTGSAGCGLRLPTTATVLRGNIAG